ncbi:MAG: fibronectin type III domain-containing protein [Bacteroidetes bacterium]|nr:fibronectin type III domain-containing protein [Bacteroidota bacterium]
MMQICKAAMHVCKRVMQVCKEVMHICTAPVQIRFASGPVLSLTIQRCLVKRTPTAVAAEIVAFKTDTHRKTTLSGFTSQFKYTVSVYAVNDFGASLVCDPITVTTS